MASYDYRCRECDATFEVQRAMSAVEDGLTCPEGHADVARVWSAVGLTSAGVRGGAVGGGGARGDGGGGCCGGGCCA